MLLNDRTPSTLPEHNGVLITQRYCLSTEKTTVKRTNYNDEQMIKTLQRHNRQCPQFVFINAVIDVFTDSVSITLSNPMFPNRWDAFR
jgi:hypothetical protein